MRPQHSEAMSQAPVALREEDELPRIRHQLNPQKKMGSLDSAVTLCHSTMPTSTVFRKFQGWKVELLQNLQGKLFKQESAPAVAVQQITASRRSDTRNHEASNLRKISSNSLQRSPQVIVSLSWLGAGSNESNASNARAARQGWRQSTTAS